MEAALYHPQHGYYTRLWDFGAAGDFVTSPELHPVFGLLLARQAQDVWQQLGRPDPFRVLEIGGGTGALARAFIDGLRWEAPACRIVYAIDERSPALRGHQQDLLAGYPVRWDASDEAFHLILANELLDAQPVHRVTLRQGRLRELRVGHGLTWVEAEPPAEVSMYFARLGVLPVEDGIAEVNLGLADWVRGTLSRLAADPGGLLLVLDYGFPAEELFRRPHGTLLTYYRHTLGSDPLVRLGRQDISVHVDFTTLATAAHGAGVDVLGVTSQRSLLRNLGLEVLLRELRAPADQRAVQQLVDPGGLGRIGALFLARGLADYQPAGLVGRAWSASTQIRIPTLSTPEEPAPADFLDQWREAFATEQ